MWSLLVFILIFGQPSQVTLPGFASEAACLDAGHRYRDQLKEQDPGDRLMFSALCVPMAPLLITKEN